MGQLACCGASRNTAKIEQISIAKLRAGNNFEISKLIDATINIGFFYAVDHNVDTQVIRDEANDFFELDLEQK